MVAHVERSFHPESGLIYTIVLKCFIVTKISLIKAERELNYYTLDRQGDHELPAQQ